MSANSSRMYPPELRERAVRMVAEIREQHETEWAAMRAVAELFGVGRCYRAPWRQRHGDQRPATPGGPRASEHRLNQA
jgi:transposase-like protein